MTKTQKNNDKALLYAELEIKWTKRFSWFLSRSLMASGVVAIIVYAMFPSNAQRIIDGLFGALAFFILLNGILFFREKKLKRFLG